MLGVSQFLTLLRQFPMDNILSKIAHFFSVDKSLAMDDGSGNVAHQLMERAHTGAGRDPRQAQELRDAASAYLSVIR